MTIAKGVEDRGLRKETTVSTTTMFECRDHDTTAVAGIETLNHIAIF